MENMVKEAVRESILACAEKYGFDGDAEVRHQLEKIAIIKAVKAKGSSGSNGSIDLSFPLPFIPSEVKDECCQGLKYNRGLFTQCMSKKGESSELCKTCVKMCCGTVSDRLAVGLMEYKDSKGRKPVAYMTLLKRMKKSDEEVDAFVKSLEFEIPEEHLIKEVKEVKELKEVKEVKEVKKQGGRGRPKKGASVVNAVVEEEANLMDLMSEIETDKSSVSVVVETEGVSVVTDMKKEKDQVKEQKKQEAKEQKKQEALAKKELAKQQKAKEAEVKKEQKAKEKELKKQEKPKADKKKYELIEFEGKKYRNEENIIYEKRYSEEHKKDIWEEAGVWDEVEKKIVFYEDEDDVSEESESDEETV